MKGNNIEEEDLEKIIENCKKLEILVVMNSTNLKNEKLFEGIEQKLPFLKEIDFSRTKFSPSIISYFSNLKQLDSIFLGIALFIYLFIYLFLFFN